MNYKNGTFARGLVFVFACAVAVSQVVAQSEGDQPGRQRQVGNEQDQKPGGAQGQGGAQKPGGAQGQGGAQKPGGAQNQGSAQKPGGVQGQGGAQKPGGMQGQGGAQKPGGAQGQGGGQKPAGAQGQGGGQKPAGAQGQGGGQKPSGAQGQGGGQKPGGAQNQGGAQKPGGVQGQGGAKKPGGAQARGPGPRGPSLKLGSQKEGVPGGPEALEEMVSIQYPNMPLPQILLAYEKLTGMTVIQEAQVQNATLTIQTNRKMKRMEAAKFIEKSLLLNGYALVPSDLRTLKIVAVPSKQGQARSEGLPIYSSPKELPDTDQLVAYVMKFEHLGAEEAATALGEVFPSHGYGTIVPFPQASSVVITDNTSVIKRYLDLKSYLDVPSSDLEVSIRMFTLERADAERRGQDCFWGRRDT